MILGGSAALGIGFLGGWTVLALWAKANLMRQQDGLERGPSWPNSLVEDQRHMTLQHWLAAVC
jgi:hypothetical protein